MNTEKLDRLIISFGTLLLVLFILIDASHLVRRLWS